MLVKCEHLTKTFGRKIVLNDINFTIPRGKIIGLLGPNGCGKSTLIKLMNHLLTPTNGRIVINGIEPSIETAKIVSYLPERSYLDESQTPRQIIHFFSDFYEDFNAHKASQMINSFKISLDDKIKSFSKGMKEKVQLALVLSRDADLYILDEPMSGIDPASREVILDMILTHFNESSSVIISTHLIADIERILDEVIFIKDQKILINQSTDELRQQYNMSIDHIFREVYK